MIDLYPYYGKNVNITFTDGDILSGKAVYYTSAINDPDERASLSIESNENAGLLVVAYADEIADIKILN